MRAFRARYDERFTPEPERLLVEVIGFHCANRGIYRAPGGIPSWRIMMFHEQVRVTAASKTVTAEPHTLFLFPPNAPTHYGRDRGRWSHSWIRVAGKDVPSIVAEHGIPPAEPVRFGSCAESDTWLSLIHRELHHGGPTDPVIVRSLLAIWLRQIRRRLPQEAAPGIPEAFLRVKQHIETGYLRPLALADLAEMAHLSRQHFCERFRAHFGVTPIDYAIRLRIQHAIELLGDANLNVTQVAERCGFGDVYYFSRAFKKHAGASPSRFRARRLGA